MRGAGVEIRMKKAFNSLCRRSKTVREGGGREGEI
jgi:hypothetical protein